MPGARVRPFMGRRGRQAQPSVRSGLRTPVPFAKDGDESGAGGIRTPVPKQSASRVYMHSHQLNLGLITAR